MLLNLFIPNKPKKDINSNENRKANLIRILEAGKIVKAKRIDFGFSLRAFSLKTKISTTVLEAIENGYLENLPEEPYLISILTKIEEELELEKDTLKKLLKKEPIIKSKSNEKFFITSKIDLFSNWTGNILYTVFLFASIILLNKQQRSLTIKYTQTISPLNTEVDVYKNFNTEAPKK